jgi:hypothetical protein
MKLSGSFFELRLVSYVGTCSSIRGDQETIRDFTWGCIDPGLGYAEGSRVGETVVVIGPTAILPT